MRKVHLLRAATALFVLSAPSAYAMCGSNLSPSRTPYALLQSQTADATTTATVARPACLKALPRAQ
jgi:hypothetical protein